MGWLSSRWLLIGVAVSGLGLADATSIPPSPRATDTRIAVADLARADSEGGEAGTGVTVSPRFFGMHIEQQFNFEWPLVPFAVQRVWDAYPAVDWAHANPAPGRFDWTSLDRLVADSLKHGVELVYVFGGVPAWASSQPRGSCGEGTPGTCYPPDPKAWADFVTTVTARYRNRIGYWELWNEPDAAIFWRGSPADLVAMAQAAYPIIKAAGGVVLAPSPQGMSGPRWLERYLAAGGSGLADVNTFHGYVEDAPEALVPLIASYRALFASFGIGNRPLWDTEHSWGTARSPFGADSDQQSAWLARAEILSASADLERSVWYGWHYAEWGALFDKTTRSVLKPGMAYATVHDWLANAGIGPCRPVSALYRCSLTRPGGQAASIVWSSGGPASFLVPSVFDHVETLDRTIEPVPPGRSIMVGMKPLLLTP